jgi:DNA (cytosine-5)-methyltransferase 1
LEIDFQHSESWSLFPKQNRVVSTIGEESGMVYEPEVHTDVWEGWKAPRELALFAGAGGGILGGHLLGWRTLCAVEWNSYARGVLLRRQEEGHLPVFPIWDDVQTFEGRPWKGHIEVVSGGFPCTDISSAGKRAGLEGKNSSLWWQMARIIGEVEPPYVFVENSPMLTFRGLGPILGSLTTMGYDANWGVISAASVGAAHRRERVWIIARRRNLLSYPQLFRPGWRQQWKKGIEEEEEVEERAGTMANPQL